MKLLKLNHCEATDIAGPHNYGLLESDMIQVDEEVI